jgi:hypothetical protein
MSAERLLASVEGAEEPVVAIGRDRAGLGCLSYPPRVSGRGIVGGARGDRERERGGN